MTSIWVKYIKGKENQIQRGNQFVIGMTGTSKTIRQVCLALFLIDCTNKKTFALRWEKICSKCRKVGNFSVVCRSVREEEINSEGNSQQFFVGAVNSAICRKNRGALGYKPMQLRVIQGLISQYHQHRPITLYLSTQGLSNQMLSYQVQEESSNAKAAFQWKFP